MTPPPPPLIPAAPTPPPTLPSSPASPNGTHAANGKAPAAAATANGANGAALSPQAAELETFLAHLTRMLVQYTDANQRPETPVVQHVPPRDLAARLDLRFADDRADLPHLLSLFQATLDYSVRTGHPLFLDKLYTGVTPVGVATELLTGALNINTHVFAASPVGTLMEMACLAELRRMIGYPVAQGAGFMSPGGSISNLVAMVTARNIKFPDAKVIGLVGMPPLAVFTSAHSHFSIEKSAMVIGLGRGQVFRVATTANGCMIPEDLEAKIAEAKEKGMLPFFVNATSGTTVLCSYDPIRPIAAIARRHGAWLHVDGSWGGSTLFSATHRHLLDGVELSDSFVMNPHKMLGVPLHCSCLLVAHPPATMVAANSSRASYLYHAPPTPVNGDDEEGSEEDAASPRTTTEASPLGHLLGAEDTDGFGTADADNDMAAALEPYDLGNLGIGCGRRADGVKFFLSWKWEGTAGYTSRVDRAFAMAALLRERVTAHPRFELVFPLSLPAADREQGANTCFWYVPAKDEKRAGGRAQWRHEVWTDAAAKARVARVTAAVRVRMLVRGNVMCDYAPLSSPVALPSFFRVPMNSPEVGEEHLDRLLAEICEIADAVVAEVEDGAATA
ncbi:Glutamate decarboxylase 2 [Blastocladiella emersonii ATCC 22665]|nr:Glutamate decarboxylase 2 [Blastocladiella emersonii ATCC 22665]